MTHALASIFFQCGGNDSISWRISISGVTMIRNSSLTVGADCTHSAAQLPAWASVTFGAVLSSDAAGRHRSLGTHISRVLSLTLDKWELSDYETWRAVD